MLPQTSDNLACTIKHSRYPQFTKLNALPIYTKEMMQLRDNILG